MSKYSFELKKLCVEAYQKGEGSYMDIAKKYGIKDKKQVINWVHSYEHFGTEGLRCSRNNRKYSFEEKLFMVESYLSSEVSYRELALANGINNPSLIARWVSDFRISGIDALRFHEKGGKNTLDISKEKGSTKTDENIIVDTSAEHVKELENELLKLRIENAFLKELRRLRLEDEAKMRELHESSTASEENLN